MNEESLFFELSGGYQFRGAVQQTDGCRTLISAIFDLQNQSFTVP